MTHANRVLVTGATGFVGSHCLAPLVERGFDVLGLYRERPPQDLAGVRWVRGDVMDRPTMRRLLEDNKPKGLLHLAWFVEPGKLITDSSNLSWVSASLDLIRAFRECGGERCTISGSCYEYDWRFGYCVEDVTPCEPDTLYGAAKDSLRRTFLTYCNVTGLSGSWGRAFFHVRTARKSFATGVVRDHLAAERLARQVIARPAGAGLSAHSGCCGRNGGAVRLASTRRL